jgi:hypothetical protein
MTCANAAMGRIAYLRGKSAEDNPNLMDSPEYFNWYCGYMDELKQALKRATQELETV